MINPVEETKTVSVVLVGDPMVGKTRLLTTLAGQECYTLTRHVTVQEKYIKLIIHDTNGHKDYRSLTTMYQQMAEGLFLVYDVSRKQTLNFLGEWLSGKVTKQKMKHDMKIKIIIGNKIDMAREVSSEEGRKFAEKYGALYCETNATERQCVEEVVEEFIKKIPSILDTSKKPKRNCIIC